MSALAQILERRARLLAEAEAQRHALAEGIAVCRSVLVVVDRGIAWATWLRARPYLVVAAATAIAVLRPKLALAWSARVVTLWRAGRFLYEAVKPALRERAAAEHQTIRSS
jgi:YqjK-like protein